MKIISWIKKKILWLFLGGVVLAATVTTLPPEQTLTERVEQAPITERAKIKAAEVAKIGAKPKTARSLYDIQIISTTASSSLLEVPARVWTRASPVPVYRQEETSPGVFTNVLSHTIPPFTQIGFGTDGTVDIERFTVKNVPILVGDSNGTIVRTSYDPVLNATTTRRLREDPEEALYQVLEDTLSVKEQRFGSENIVAGKVGNTTLTVYPNAGTGSAPIDGYLLRGNASGESYSTMRNGAGTEHTDSTALEVTPYLKAYSVGSSWANGAETNIRGGYGYDTSSIGTDTVDSGTFSLWANAVKIVAGWAAEDVVELTKFTPADGADFANSDYNIANFEDTRLATGIDLANITTGQYNDWTLNASGLAAVNKTGNTFFGTRWKFDVDNVDPPTWENNNMYLQVYFADQAGTTNDPKGVFEHSVAAAVASPAKASIIIFE